jgi:hypothetical protein
LDRFSEVYQIFPHFAFKSKEREVKSPCFYYVWWALKLWVRTLFMASNDLKRMQLTSLKKKTDLKRLTGRLKLHLLTEIGQFHWNQGEKVAHFAWFGPCSWNLTHTGFDVQYFIPNSLIASFLRSLSHTFVLWKVGGHAVVGKETLKFW